MSKKKERWYVFEKDAIVNCRPNGKTKRMRKGVFPTPENPEPFIAFAQKLSGGPREAREQRRRARLLASAPRLLEALTDLLEALEEWENDFVCPGEEMDVVLEARRAIAEATRF